MKNGITLIMEERERQITEEGWTNEHDFEWAFFDIWQSGSVSTSPLSAPDHMSDTFATVPFRHSSKPC